MESYIVRDAMFDDIETYKAYRMDEVDTALAAKDQRIAELESLIDEANHLIGAYQKGAENVTRTINRLQAESERLSKMLNKHGVDVSKIQVGDVVEYTPDVYRRHHERFEVIRDRCETGFACLHCIGVLRFDQIEFHYAQQPREERG